MVHNKFKKILDELENINLLKDDGSCSIGHIAFPSKDVLINIIKRIKIALFPKYFFENDADIRLNQTDINSNIAAIAKLLTEQIVSGLAIEHNGKEYSSLIEKAELIVEGLIDRLPKIKTDLISDIYAAYGGDPAAKSIWEVIVCYPGIEALFHHRIAHELYKLQVPIIPRLINEIAHSATGIDIHPGAEIGESFFIDHGTGVVIGETCIIGKNVRIYQGVTLGAKKFPEDENGFPIKGILRHPIVENNVVIYANACILGRITIGESCIIPGNSFITNDFK